MRPLLLLLAAALTVAAVVVGLGQASTGGSPQPAAGPPDPSIAGDGSANAPPALSELHAQANALLPGGERALERRLEALRGHPVVLNKWASWCAPCRAEAPFLQSQATLHGNRVAFLGLAWRDTPESARGFLDRHPLPFPSYQDPGGELAEALRLPAAIPVTIFLDERGEMAYLRQGAYRGEEDLAADIERYLPPS